MKYFKISSSKFFKITLILMALVLQLNLKADETKEEIEPKIQKQNFNQMIEATTTEQKNLEKDLAKLRDPALIKDEELTQSQRKNKRRYVND